MAHIKIKLFCPD